MTRRALQLAIITLIATVMLSGCSGRGNEAALSGQIQTVKVMYYDEQQFFRDYGELLYAKYPNLEIEVANQQSIYAAVNQSQEFDHKQAFIDFIEKERPDVLMLSMDQYKEFYEDGLLLDLEPFIEKDKYDIETILPGVVEYLREGAGGRLHGLAPRFHATALYYNAGLFDQYGITPPTDQMSWEEVLQLAQRFPSDGPDDERIYGLTSNMYMQYANMLQTIAATESLSFVDPIQKQVTVDSDAWRRLIQNLTYAYRLGAINKPADPEHRAINMSYEDYLLSHPFVAGKSAMFVDGINLMDQLRQASQSLPDRTPVDYQLVTAPVDSMDRERGGQMQIYQIFVVNAASEQTDNAWQVVKHINSEEMARIKSKSTAELLTRTTHTSGKDGRSLEAFYKLKPNPYNPYEDFSELPDMFFGQFLQLLNTELKAIIEEDKPIDEAIRDLQREGQKALMQAEAAAE